MDDFGSNVTRSMIEREHKPDVDGASSNPAENAQSGLLAFPWSEAMAFGLGTLKLAPDAFWSMTPRELSAAFHGLYRNGQAASGLDFSSLRTLMRQNPDLGDDEHGCV